MKFQKAIEGEQFASGLISWLAAEWCYQGTVSYQDVQEVKLKYFPFLTFFFFEQMILINSLNGINKTTVIKKIRD
jgi:hypothetical protein